jgi:hypothetical protein
MPKINKDTLQLKPNAQLKPRVQLRSKRQRQGGRTLLNRRERHQLFRELPKSQGALNNSKKRPLDPIPNSPGVEAKGQPPPKKRRGEKNTMMGEQDRKPDQDNPRKVNNKRQRQGGRTLLNRRERHQLFRVLPKSQGVLRSLTRSIDGALEIITRHDKENSAAGFALAMERKVGKRPDLTGVGKIATLMRYAAAIKKLQGQWGSMSFDERVEAIGTAASAELTKAGVPELLAVDTDEMKDSMGRFYHLSWKIRIKKDLVSGDALSDADAAQLCNTMMHEARHAEQIFLAARYIAWDSDEISAEVLASILEIPILIAEDAVAKKFNDDTDLEDTDLEEVVLLGKKMALAYVVNGKENQKISGDNSSAHLKFRTALDKAKKAEKALDANPTDARVADATIKLNNLKAATAEFEQSHKLYRNIPYEADAHEVGDAAELAFNEWV